MKTAEMSKYIITIVVVLAALAIYFMWVGPLIAKYAKKPVTATA